MNQDYPYLGDEVFLRQLFVIFLANAIKYSPQNTSIKVNLEAGNGTMRVRFEDHGTGISREHQAHIFDRFYRVDKACSRARGGTGLGLAIVKAIVDAHGGQVWAEPATPPGARVVISLPLKST